MLSGTLLAFSFPSFGHPLVAWVALTPLLLALGHGSHGRAFRLGVTCGIVYFSGTLYWLTFVMHTYGGLQVWSAVLVNVLLIAYQAAFPAVFALTMRRLIATAGRPALLAAPAAWVSIELGRTYVFTGFPWVLLGYSQVTVLPMAQLASVAGVYGVSALVALPSAALAFALDRRLSSHDASRATTTWGPLTAALVIVGAVGLWGRSRLDDGSLAASTDAVRVGLVQGNVDQGEKWNPSRAEAIFADHLEKTRDAIDQGADLVVWPESSIPFLFDEDRPNAERVRALARSSGVSLLIGSDQVERGRPRRWFNSALLIDREGKTAAVYRKMHLVPFGEYVPMKRLLFFAAPLVEQVSDFSPGVDGVLLPLDQRRLSAAICYEVVYPDLVRRSVLGGSELLTTITNDAWFGPSSAPYQHFAQASMRAIENGRYLVRAANTGVSGIVDPYGRILAASRIFEPAVIVGDVHFLSALTIYTRIGDAFAYACLFGTAVLLVVSLRGRSRFSRVE